MSVGDVRGEEKGRLSLLDIPPLSRVEARVVRILVRLTSLSITLPTSTYKRGQCAVSLRLIENSPHVFWQITAACLAECFCIAIKSKCCVIYDGVWNCPMPVELSRAARRRECGPARVVTGSSAEVTGSAADNLT